MSESPRDPYLVLVEQSLIAWRLLAKVTRTGDGALLIAGLGRSVRVERAPPDLPFRWFVTADGRRRSAVSVVAVLKQIRGTLDPGYASNRIRVAASVM